MGFPATPLLTARIRVCISAAHTRADLDYALEVFAEMIDRWGRSTQRAAGGSAAGCGMPAESGWAGWQGRANVCRVG